MPNKFKKKLWEVFSEFIRLRDSWIENDKRVFNCISCGKTQHAEGGNLQAGHYFKSEMYSAIRYDEKNVNGQCRGCNIFKEGNRQGYEFGLIRKYGKQAIEILEIKKHNKTKLGTFEYTILIEEYKQKLTQLKSKQNGNQKTQ